MDAGEAIRARRSIRKYQSGVEIPQKDLERMLEAAMMAPSAVNSRPWEFVVVRSKKKREEIAAVHPHAKMLPQASLGVAVCARPERLPARLNGFWPQDCAAAIENLLLQATALGYGAVWCGVYPVTELVEKVQKLLGVDSVPVAVVAIGVPDEQPKARGYFDPQRVSYID